MIYQTAYHQMLNYWLMIHLFSVEHDINAFVIKLNIDLKKINDWAFRWKMTFNPDRSKQAQELYSAEN